MGAGGKANHNTETMDDQTKYKIEKEIKKQKIVRNEFLYHGNSVGKYEFPIIRKQNIDVSKIKLLSYVDTKADDKENKDKTIHFFTHDWKFEKVYENADKELEKLKQYYCLLSPDFSMFTNMPIALQIASVFKNRWCGAYWQSKGLNVIPVVSWSDEKSFDFCFDGIEEGSIVFVCTYYCENDEMSFMAGYREMIKRIKPSLVLCYDEPFDAMGKNVISFLPTTYEWIKTLPPQEQARFYLEKKLRNVIGLDPSSFKYIKYEDPYVRNIPTKCPVCGRVVLVEQFGNGECENCTWNVDNINIKFPDRVEYPNMISLNKARKLYREGKPFKPSFDDFIEGLEKYSEMTFYYKKKEAAVFFYTDEEVRLEWNGKTTIYSNTADFRQNARLDGKLLSEIWNDVERADYMQG